jgi:hypothetical protein
MMLSDLAGGGTPQTDTTSPVHHPEGIKISVVGVPRHTCALLLGLLATDCDCQGYCTGGWQRVGSTYDSAGTSPLPDEW